MCHKYFEKHKICKKNEKYDKKYYLFCKKYDILYVVFKKRRWLSMWLFLTSILATLPIIMLVLGKNFVRVRPRRKNCKIYYRTERSMVDETTTRFAHQFCGKFYLWMGKRLLLITIILSIIFLKMSLQVYETMSGVWLLVETIILLIAVPFTEHALQEKFGTRYEF